MAAVPSIGRASLVEAQTLAPGAIAAHELYERHAAKIHSYCRHQLGSHEEAEDAVQTTFMNAFRALRKGVVPEAEAAWLYKIAENVCLSRRRSSWRRNRIESPADFEVIEEVVAGPSPPRDELIGIEDALASMPEQQRRAILLREWQGLSYREISAELELSQSAVETLIFRARRSLAHGLTDPASLKPQPKRERRRLRRTLHLADLASLLAGAKSLLAGAGAVKATAAAVAVTAAAGTAVTVGPSLVQPPPKPKPTLAVPAAPAEERSARAIEVSRASAVAVFAAPAAAAEPASAKPAPAKPKAAAAEKAKGKAAGAHQRRSARPTLPPAATQPERAQPTNRRAARPEPSRQPKRDAAQQRTDQQARLQAARAERQAERNRAVARIRAARADAKRAARPAVAVSPTVAAAPTDVAEDVRSQGQDRSAAAVQASGSDARLPTGKPANSP